MTALRDVAIRLDEGRRREFRRVLAISAALHLTGFLALAFAPGLPRVSPPAAIAVNLVAAPGAARAVPAPTAAPKPKPKPPKPAPVVLPTEPTAPKPEPKAEPKPKPEPEKPKPREEPKPPAEQEYTDVLEQLRAEVGEPEPQPSAEPAAEVGPTASIGVPGGEPVSAEVSAWMRDARVHIRRNWAVPPGFRTESLVTEVEVELDAAGNVQGEPRLRRRSGNPWYDDGVVRGVRKASPLPAPPEAGTWIFVMVSDEDY